MTQYFLHACDKIIYVSFILRQGTVDNIKQNQKKAQKENSKRIYTIFLKDLMY